MTLTSFIEKLPSFSFLVEKAKSFEGESDYSYSSGVFTSNDGTSLKWERVFWEDGAGNEANLVLFPELEQAILYGYDHESSFNYYDTDNEQVIFTNLPVVLREFIESSMFHWSWATGDEARTWATCAYWLNEEGEWEVSKAWEEVLNWDYDDGGSQYTLGRFLN